MSSQRSPSSRKILNNDMLVRGVILTMIGLILIIAPHFMSPSDTRDLFRHAQVPAWFALVLGLAFIGQYARKVQRDKQQEK